MFGKIGKLVCLGLAICLVVVPVASAELGRITTEPLTLDYWIPLGAKASQVITSNAEIPVYDVFEEKTGVNINWIHPSATDAGTQLSLMIASQQLPDMIFYNWTSFSGGLAKALADNVIIPLNDMIDQYAPNYKALLDAHPDLAKQVSLDDGTIALFPSARTDMAVRVWFGPQIRQDWLESVGKEIPNSIDDWYDVLKAFKENDVNKNGDPNDEIPFVAAGASNLNSYLLSFAGAYGLVRADFCLKDDRVVFSPAEPAYKDFLTEMNKWYTEGLLDPDFAAVDGAGVKSLVTSNQAGAYFGSLAGNLGAYNTALQEVCPEGKIVSAPWASGAAGIAYQNEAEHTKAYNGAGAVITTACRNVEAAVKWLDAHYSAEGSMLMNFGIEGLSYEMIDGYPTFTDLIANSPDGLAFDIAMSKYSLAANTTEVMNQDAREFAQLSLRTDHQKAANKIWGSGDISLIIPPTSLTIEESTEYSKIMSEIDTYVAESIVRFIMNQIPLENFDDFVNNLKAMNIDRAIEIRQQAYDRYMAR